MVIKIYSWVLAYILLTTSLQNWSCALGVDCNGQDMFLNPDNGACYFFSRSHKLRQPEARDICENTIFRNGGYLTDILDAAEQQYIERIIGTVGSSDYWFGLTDLDLNGAWNWSYPNSSDVSATWTNWDWEGSYPRGQQCAYLKQSENYLWRDDNCDAGNPYICKVAVEAEATSVEPITPNTAPGTPSGFNETSSEANDSSSRTRAMTTNKIPTHVPTDSTVSSRFPTEPEPSRVTIDRRHYGWSRSLSNDTEMKISFLYLLEEVQLVNKSHNLQMILEMINIIVQQSTDILREHPDLFPYVPFAIDEVMLRISSMLQVGDTICLSTDSIYLEIEAREKETLHRKWRFPSQSFGGDDGDKVGWDDDTIDIVMPTINDNCNVNASMVTVGVLYRGVSDQQSDRVLGSNIVSTTLAYCDDVVSVPATFSLTLQDLATRETRDHGIACSYLDFANMDERWQTTGCRIESKSETQVTCHCDHTTNFAVLLQIVPFKLDPFHGQILSYISLVGGAISLMALMTAFALYICLRSTLVSERMTIHKHLLVAMFLLQLTILISSAIVSDRIFCKISAILVHYSSTAMFLWMLIEGVQLYRQVVRVYGSETSWMNYYYLTSWGLPAIMVSITIAIGWNEYGEGQSCWLSSQSGLIWFFAAPVLAIILINTFILICVVKVVYSASEARDGAGYSKDNASRASIRSTLMLLPLLGLTWVVGFFAINNDTVVFLYLFTILNSLQGLFVFTFHILLNTEMRNAIQRKKHIREITKMELISSTGGILTSRQATTSSNACSVQDVEDYVIATPPSIIIDDPVLTSFSSIKDHLDDNSVTTLNCPDNNEGKQ